MRNFKLALAALSLGALAGCSASKPATATASSEGVLGQYYFVNLFTPPTGGVITSDVGGIDCGAASVSVDATVTPPRYVYAYYPSGAGLTSRCGQVRLEWSQPVVLTATPRDGNAFLGWAGDCTGSGTCRLTPGPDRSVVAIFGLPGSGHASFMDPAVHGPAFFGAISGTGPLRCATCHGADLAGQGIAPSCNACHASHGWAAGWQANCSFCHGARTPATQAGYLFADHPEWSAPPDPLSVRLTGTPAPDRTGAHQAHLSGVTPSGLSVAGPFRCATCHPVPTDLSHISGSASRAQVVLSGAGQASLPADLGSYDPASGRCATACHGAAGSPAWSATGLRCDGCHGVPPPAPHPYTGADLAACAGCHPDSVGADGSIRPGGKHLDGLIQASGGHADYALPAVHGPAFLDFQGGVPGALSCTGCHGASYGGGVGPSCNACHASQGWSGWQTNCSFCHGTRDASTRAGYDVALHPAWAAPPDAVAQRLDPAHAARPERSGAHQAHLTGTTAGGLSFAGPFLCATCHVIAAGHVQGGGARASVALSGAGQGSLPAALGSYDQVSGACTTACHGAAPSPAWATSGVVCGTCHALPPAPGTGHPSVPTALTGCATCHPDTMRPDGSLDVAGGKHVDGVVEASGGHPDWSAPATHAPQFFASLRGTAAELDCTRCHGATYDGGLGPSCSGCHASSGWTADWRTNCSFCHGTRNATTRTTPYSVATSPTLSAPPDALAQRLGGAADATRTGAHQAHLTGKGSGTGTTYGAPIACGTCHTVPADYRHAGGPGRAPVALTDLTGSLPANLGSYSAASGTCTTYCHGATLANPTPPAWSGGELGCTGCHGNPPMTGQHDYHVNQLGSWCADCHTSSVTYPPPYIGAKHLNGKVDVDFYQAYLPATKYSGGTCSTVTCHPFSYSVSW